MTVARSRGSRPEESSIRSHVTGNYAAPAAIAIAIPSASATAAGRQAGRQPANAIQFNVYSQINCIFWYSLCGAARSTWSHGVGVAGGEGLSREFPAD